MDTIDRFIELCSLEFKYNFYETPSVIKGPNYFTLENHTHSISFRYQYSTNSDLDVYIGQFFSNVNGYSSHGECNIAKSIYDVSDFELNVRDMFVIIRPKVGVVRG